MSDKIKEAAKEVKKLENKMREIISSSSLNSGFQTEVKLYPAQPKTSEELYLFNMQTLLSNIK